MSSLNLPLPLPLRSQFLIPQSTVYTNVRHSNAASRLFPFIVPPSKRFQLLLMVHSDKRHACPANVGTSLSIHFLY